MKQYHTILPKAPKGGREVNGGGEGGEEAGGGGGGGGGGEGGGAETVIMNYALAGNHYSINQT